MKELKELPVLTDTTCRDCGATDWNKCNTHPEGGVHQCSKCTEWDEATQKLIRKNVQ